MQPMRRRISCEGEGTSRKAKVTMPLARSVDAVAMMDIIDAEICQDLAILKERSAQALGTFILTHSVILAAVRSAFSHGAGALHPGSYGGWVSNQPFLIRRVPD
jgi:hypothetical protein